MSVESTRRWRASNPQKSWQSLQKSRQKFVSAHPNANKNSMQKYRYGISLAEKEARLKEQGGCCAICKTTEPRGYGWCTDHDHFLEITTGEIVVRGILCHSCNTLLGHARDNEETLLSAIEYLKISRG